MNSELRLRVPVLALLVALALPAVAVDREWLRAWEAAQAAKPARLAASSRIASVSEPGTPLSIEGRVLANGRPVANALVFAWQTDANGVYDRPGRPAHSWRLRGWARTDERGAFSFQTIRPASYPRSRIEAHVHFTVETTDGRRYFADDLNFADDPFVIGTRHERTAARVVQRDGRQHVRHELKLDESNRF